MHECYGDANSPNVKINEWFAISACVDTVVGTMLTYINGQLASTIKVAQLCKDGQHAIKRRLALFWSKDDADGGWARSRPPSGSGAAGSEAAFKYVRSIAVHTLNLDAEQVGSMRSSGTHAVEIRRDAAEITRGDAMISSSRPHARDW